MNSIFSKKYISLLSIILIIALLFNNIWFSSSAEETTPSGGSEVPEFTEEQLAKIVLDKSVAVSDNVTDPSEEGRRFTLTVKSFVTGDLVKTTAEKTFPTDIVLVLDQSGSMAFDFNGNSTNTASKTRQYALKNAVNKFIDNISVNKNGSTEIPDHRISIVTYDSSASTLIGWTKLDTDGVAALKKKVDGLPTYPEGGTYTDEGMEEAQNLLTTKYSAPASGEERKKAVILFTDGVPGSSGYSTTIADRAIKTANELKKDGVVVYSIGIFQHANADEMYAKQSVYGSYGFSTYCESEAEGNYWADSSFLGLGDMSAVDCAAANRFLNFISSNYPDAVDDRLSDESIFFIVEVIKYVLQGNLPARAEGDYYLTASDAPGLASVFESVSEEIIGANTDVVEINETAIIKDIISNYFKLPSNADSVKDIKVYTAKCNGYDEKTKKFSFDEENRQNVEDDSSPFKNKIKVTITDYGTKEKADVSVTGFDFADVSNCVAYKNGDVTGRELIIEFDILLIDGFAGGNNVPTNDPDSGVYLPGQDKPLKPYPKPSVNIPIIDPTFTFHLSDIAIYHGNTVKADQFLDIPELDAIPNAYDFVERTISYKENGEWKSAVDEKFSPTSTYKYPKNEIKVELKPKKTEAEEGQPDPVGEEAKAVSKESTEDFTIYVLQPYVSVSLQDIKRFYGTEYNLATPFKEAEKPSVTVTWKEPDPENASVVAELLKKDVEGVFVPFTVDDIYLDYSPINFTGSKTTVTKKAPTVKAQLKFGKAISSWSAAKDSLVSAAGISPIYQTTCSFGCTTRSDGTYKVHCDMGSLTINNVGGKSDEIFVYTILKDGEPYTTVSVNGDSELTLYELPSGTYTVKIGDEWSWRYKSEFENKKNQTSVTISESNPTATVKCTNTLENKNWVSEISALVRNIFGESDK